MKQFDLKLAKAGHPVCTRDGRKARIVCYDRQSRDNMPILALVEDGMTHEGVVDYDINGRCCPKGTQVGLDLVMASVKHEGWVNIYRLDDGKISPGAYVNDSKEEAMKATIGREKRLIATVKIEWEE